MCSFITQPYPFHLRSTVCLREIANCRGIPIQCVLLRLSLFSSIVASSKTTCLLLVPLLSLVDTAMVQFQPALRAKSSKHAIHFSETDESYRPHEVLDNDDAPQNMILPPCLRIQVRKTNKKHCAVRVEDNTKKASVVWVKQNTEQELKGLADQTIVVETKEHVEEEVRDLNETPLVKETEVRSSLKYNDDDKINMSFTLDSESSDEISRMHSFEMTVNDEIVESSLEVTYENFADLEKQHKEPLKKIVEGSDNSTEATCGASAKDLDLSEGDIESQDCKHGDSSSKQSTRSKSSTLSNMHSALLAREDQSLLAHEDDCSVGASQRSVASKTSFRDAFRKKGKCNISRRSDHGSEASGSHSSTKRGSGKHDTPTVFSKCSIKSKVGKYIILSTKAKNDSNVSIKRSSDDHDETSVGSTTSNHSVYSKQEAFTMSDKHQNGNASGATMGKDGTVSSSIKNKISMFSIASTKSKDDSSVSIKRGSDDQDATSVGSTLSNHSVYSKQEAYTKLDKHHNGTAIVLTKEKDDNLVNEEKNWCFPETPSGNQCNEELKALGMSEIEKLTIQVGQIKAALLKRIDNRDERVPAVEKAMEEEMKKNIKFLEKALGAQKQIEAEFTSYLVKAASWQTPEIPVPQKPASDKLVLPPPSRAGPNLKVVEVDSKNQAKSANNIPWYDKMRFWQNNPTAEYHGGAGDDGARAAGWEDDVLLSDEGIEDSANVGQFEAVQSEWRNLVQTAHALQLSFFDCADESHLIQVAHTVQKTFPECAQGARDTIDSKDVSRTSRKNGRFGRFGSFLAQKVRYVKVELTDFLEDLLDAFFSNSPKAAAAPEYDDKTAASGDQSVFRKTCENSDASAVTKEAAGDKCPISEDSEKSDPIGKVVSIESEVP